MVNRRKVVRILIVLFALIIALMFELPARLHRLIKRRSPQLAKCVPEIYRSLEAERIGRAYLANHPEERELRVLEELLAVSDAEHFCSRIGDRALKDYRGGDLVQVHGWVLARTEARLCALSAL